MRMPGEKMENATEGKRGENAGYGTEFRIKFIAAQTLFLFLPLSFPISSFPFTLEMFLLVSSSARLL